MTVQHPQVSQLLQEWRRGNQQAADQVVHAVYDELRRIARGMMRGERSDHTLQPTALIHEAYLRVCRDEAVDVQTRAAFLRLMAAQMKRHLIDYARRRSADKRGGGVPHEESTVFNPRRQKTIRARSNSWRSSTPRSPDWPGITPAWPRLSSCDSSRTSRSKTPPGPWDSEPEPSSVTLLLAAPGSFASWRRPTRGRR